MMIPVKSLWGIGGIPTCRRNAGNWLRARDIPLQTVSSKAGPAEAVYLSDLPEEVRRAYTVKALEALELDPGTYDEEANAALMAATPGMREAADRQAICETNLPRGGGRVG